MDLKLRVNTQKKAVRSSLELEEELEPVSPTSEYFLSEALTLYILCFFELEIPVDFSSTIAFLNDVFINIHPRFSSIAVENKKGRKMWKRVTVNVEDHIKVQNFSQELSPEKFSEQYDNYISKIATSQLPPNKPLWELHVINCPKDHHAPAIFILKIHHAIGDGTSLMAGVFSCLRRVDDPSLPPTFPSKNKPTSETQHNATPSKNLMNFFKIHAPDFISSIIYSLYDFGHIIGSLSFEDTKTPIRSGSTDMTLPFSARVCSLALSLKNVKTIKDHLGVTINDVIIGIIFLGTRLYIQETQQQQLKNARATASILVDIRNVKGNLSLDEMLKGKLWGNRISIMELPLPILEDEDLTNPLKFILKAHNIIKRKRSGIYSPYLLAGMLDIVRAFAGLQTAARFFERIWKNSSFALTNVIGPTDQFSVANHPVNGFYFVPTGGNLSLTVSVMSYMETLRLGLVVENGFIDHQRLITCVQKAFELIFQSAQATSISH